MTRSAYGSKGKPKKYVVRLTEEDVEILRQATTISDEFFTHDKFVYVIGRFYPLRGVFSNDFSRRIF